MRLNLSVTRKQKRFIDAKEEEVLFGGAAGAPDVSIYTIGYYLYTKILGATTSEFPYFAAFGLVLTFITVPVAFLTRYLLNKFGPSVE